jgi:ubiquinone/menaquinone biosynthesis C-methylase UbiE
MSTTEIERSAIQRQYNEVIAANYDLDPQFVTNRALNRALAHVEREAILSAELPTMSVFDVGMGTGLFSDKLLKKSKREINPFGLDVSEKMIEIAQSRIPQLNAVIDDAANIDRHFPGESFDLICTHFITGFVPIDHLAPRIWSKLKPGGYWSFVGAVTTAYPELQRKANTPLIRMFNRGRKAEREKLITPTDCNAVASCFERHSFETCSIELFEPELVFNDFEDFMEYAYRGGWLTPFVEHLGLQKVRPLTKKLLTSLLFPIHDRHRIAIGLARRPLSPDAPPAVR